MTIGSEPGQTDEQVRVERCRFYAAGGPVMSLAIGANSGPGSRVRCEDCLFSSPNTHVYVADSFQQVSFVGNVFFRGINGINVNLSSWSTDSRVEIVNNTFVEMKYWVGMLGSFPSGPGESRVCNNLILGGERVQGKADQWELVLSKWRFAGNCWEVGATTNHSLNYEERIAMFHEDLDVPVRDAPNDPRFLVPAARSPLLNSGVGGDLPLYVGAKGPVSSPP